MSKEWPSSITPMSEEEWMALATSEDAKEQQQVSSALKKLGYGAREFVRWDPEQRVETIMKHQPAAASSSKKKAASGGKRAASKRSASTSEKAAPTKAAPAASGGGLGKEGLSLLKAILEGVEAIAAKQDELEDKLDALEPFIKETHFGFSCIALGDEALAANFENPDVQEDLYGTLTVKTDEEGDDEGEE